MSLFQDGEVEAGKALRVGDHFVRGDPVALDGEGKGQHQPSVRRHNSSDILPPWICRLSGKAVITGKT